MKKSSMPLLALFLLLADLSYSQKQFGQDYSWPSMSEVSLNDSVVEKDCRIKDLRDYFRSWFGRKDKAPKPQKNFNILILPNISYNPINGLLLGVGGVATMFLGSKETTHISYIGYSIAVTSKKQFLFTVKSNIFTKNDKFFFQGDLRFYKYRAPTYGLGTNSPDTTFEGTWAWQGADISETDGSYPMLYNYLIFHEIANRRITESFYGGIGYQLDMYWSIKDDLLNLDTLPKQLTPHWGYSHIKDFDTANYTTSGFSLNLMYDSRDNQISPYKGYYANINYRINTSWLGSDQNSTRLWLEFRTYVGLSRKIPRHLLAFWFWGNFLISGDQPYFTLMALGEDQKGRSGRGYIAGRYRGEDMLYTEMEYRFPILPCTQTIGGVIFISATTATNELSDIGLFDYVRPAFGFGLRFLINKHTRLNINIDFGFGYKSKGFYFSGSETF